MLDNSRRLHRTGPTALSANKESLSGLLYFGRGACPSPARGTTHRLLSPDPLSSSEADADVIAQADRASAAARAGPVRYRRADTHARAL